MSIVERKIRKYTESKLSSPSDDAVKRTVYLSLMGIEKKWTQSIHNWDLIMNQFILTFVRQLKGNGYAAYRCRDVGFFSKESGKRY